jgi:hypothetical protein
LIRLRRNARIDIHLDKLAASLLDDVPLLDPTKPAANSLSASIFRASTIPYIPVTATMLPKAFAALLLCAVTAQARGDLSTVQEVPVPGKATPQGCFKSLPASIAEKSRSITFLSPGSCSDACKKAEKSVAMMQGNKCFCSDVYPMSTARIQDTDCNYPCPGYVLDACGSLENSAYSVWNTGIDAHVEYEAGDDGEVNIDEEGVSWMLAVAKGAWNKGEDASAMIMAHVCKFFDCARARGGEDSDSEELFKEA